MKINFRQGVVSYQSGGFLQVSGNSVNILAGNRPVTVTIAHRDTNYTHSEDKTVNSAWVGPFTLPDYYLYWDFNPLTFERTFGHTHLEPVAQSVPPGNGRSDILSVVPGVGSPTAYGSFSVEGHYALPTNKTFAIIGSTGNDGTYTVQSYSYDQYTNITTIVANEAVPSSVADGVITLDIDSNLQPLYQKGRTWFDTANNIHYILDDNFNWVEIIRVYAGQLRNGNTLLSLSINATSGNFAGTQIGNTDLIASGRVLFAEQAGDPMRRDDGTFFTTEDQFFTNQSRVDALRLESNVQRAQSVSGGTLAAFGIVAWTDAGRITTAQYTDTGSTVVGVLTEPTNYLDVGAVIVQGTVTNPDWTWMDGLDAVPVGSELWIKNGQLVTVDPHVSDPVTNPIKQVPVARVLSTDTIIFEQGLGGVGEQGPVGTITDLPVATAGQLGMVSLSQAADDPENPIVVGINNSVIQGAPYAAETHFHAASGVSFTPIVNVTSSNVQNAIAELLPKKGGTMTGSLILNGAPTASLQAATKAYVDSIAAGLDAKEACVVGTISNVGGVYSSIGGTGGTGAFTNATIASLDGVYGTDYQLAVDARILVKDESVGVNADYRNGIYVVTSIGAGSPPTLFNMERAPDFDNNADIRAGNYTVLRSGATQAGQGWVLTDIHPTDDIELNNHPITWTLVSSAASYFGDGTTIDIDGSNIISVIPASLGGTVDAQMWNGETLTLGSPVNGQPLIYNLGTWQNGAFALPIAAGTNGYILSSNGDGTSDWIVAPATGLTAIVEDLTPQLGGDLDVNGFSIITPDVSTGSPASSGTIALQTGTNSYGGGDVGSIDITGGNSQGGTGGHINITAGNNALAGGGYGGNVTIRSGNDAYTDGTGTQIGIYGGNGAGYYAGTVAIYGGTTTRIGGANGGVYLGGQDNATGYGGRVFLVAGNSSSNVGQNIELQPGTGAVTDGSVLISPAGGTGDATLRLGSGAYYTEIGAPTLASNVTLTLPATNGTTAQVLTRDSGTGTEWSNVTTAIGTDLIFTSTPSYDWITSTKDEFSLKINSNNGVSILGTAGAPDTGYDFAGTTTPLVYLKSPDDVSITYGVVTTDGSKVMWSDNSGANPKTVHVRDLGTPFVLSSALNDYEASYTGGSGNGGVGVFQFNDDGTKMFSSYLPTDTVWEYTLSTPYDPDTAGAGTQSNSLWGGSTNGTHVFSLDGLHLFSSYESGGAMTVAEWTLSTAWDVTTIGVAPTSLKVITTDVPSPLRKAFYPAISYDGTKFFIATRDEDFISRWVMQWDLGTPYDLTTAVYNSGIGAVELDNGAAGNTGIRHFATSPDGTKAYIYNDTEIHTYDISVGDGGASTTYTALYYDGGSPPSMTTTSSGIDVNGNIVTDSGVDKLTTASGSVDVSAASAPSAGQVLTATGATTATWQTPFSLPQYERIVVSGSPPSPVINTTVSTVSASGSPVMTATLQVFRNGLLQEEDIDGASPISGDYIVSGPNQITFTDASLFDGGVIIIYSFAT